MRIVRLKVNDEYIYLIEENYKLYYLDLHNFDKFKKIKLFLKSEGVLSYKIEGLVSYD